MSTVSGLLSNYTVLGHDNGNTMLSLRHRMSTDPNKRDLNACSFVPKSNLPSKTSSFRLVPAQPLFSVSRGGNYGLKFDDEPDEDPFWLHYSKELARALKSLFAFLAEQPGQLKYIEWPSFSDTLRTATLTLILVAMLIVALSSIDSALSFVLALLLRKPA